MERRDFMKVLGGVGLGFYIGGCSPKKSPDYLRKREVKELQHWVKNSDRGYVDGKGYVFNNGDMEINLARDCFYAHRNRMKIKDGGLVVRVKLNGEVMVASDGEIVKDKERVGQGEKIADEAIVYIKREMLKN